MNRLAFQMKIKKDKIEEYKEAHRNIWPEVLDSIKKSGIHNYSIFLRGTNLFAYFEVENLNKFYKEINTGSELNDKWQEKMSEYLEEVGDLNPGEPMAFMEEVFHVD
ncbi:MAG: L-rhamnose mutarotase [Candidatus Humimicrobiaceae bacterium]